MKRRIRMAAVVAATSTVIFTASPAMATVEQPQACSNPHIEKYRAYTIWDDRPTAYVSDIELLRCPSDHAGAYSYAARLTHSYPGDVIALYYYPWGNGPVPGGSTRGDSNNQTIVTPWFYGKIGELQPCLVLNNQVKACAWS